MDPRSWNAVVDQIAEFELAPEKGCENALDWLQNHSFRNDAFRIFTGTVRHWTLLKHFVRQTTNRPPKPRLRAALLASAFDLLDNRHDMGKTAKIVHHAVSLISTSFSRAEGRFANAVLRKLATTIEDTLAQLDTPDSWALKFSHPQHLIDRWIRAYGEEKTRDLLEWNQSVPDLYLHDLGEPALQDPQSPISLSTEPTPWPGFFRLQKTRPCPLGSILEHKVYIQDPSTAVAVSLLGSPLEGRLLDACASPGGKTLHLIKRLAPEARIFATDRDTPRTSRIRENLNRLSLGDHVEIHELDWLSPTASDAFPKNSFETILVDAPCSNSGVIRRHPDVKWRLTPEDFPRMAQLQAAILDAVVPLLKPGGKLVYSTCSIDPEENSRVVETFLSRHSPGITLSDQRSCFPPEDRMDGIGAFLFTHPHSPDC